MSASVVLNSGCKDKYSKRTTYYARQVMPPEALTTDWNSSDPNLVSLPDGESDLHSPLLKPTDEFSQQIRLRKSVPLFST